MGRHPASQSQLLLLPPFFLFFFLCVCLCFWLSHFLVAKDGCSRSQTTTGVNHFRGHGTPRLHHSGR